MDASPAPTFRWPDDYISLDGGQLLVRPDCADAFIRRGWDSLEAVMSAQDVEVVRRLDARDNCRVSLETTSGPTNGFLKRHKVRTLRRWYLEHGRYRAGCSPGMAEANAVGWCQQAGVPTMSILAAGERFLNTRQSDSFFLSEELSGCTAANEYWFPFELRHHPPAEFRSDADTRRSVLRAVATTARRLHAAGLVHLDFYLEHFLVDLDSGCACLVDLQRVERPRGVGAKWRAVTKDLGQFHGSCDRYQLSAEERLEWARWYLGTDAGPVETIPAADALRLQAAALRWRMRRTRRKFWKRPRRAA